MTPSPYPRCSPKEPPQWPATTLPGLCRLASDGFLRPEAGSANIIARKAYPIFQLDLGGREPRVVLHWNDKMGGLLSLSDGN